MSEISTIITEQGFPIAMCLIFVVALKYLYDTMKAQNEAQAQKHSEEVKVLTEALNNNTVVLQKLCDALNDNADPYLPEYDTDG